MSETLAMTLVERLEDVGCDREPFTDAHKHCICRLTNEAAREISRLQSRIEELEKALKPFAEYAQQYRQSTLDIVCSGPDGCVITRGDLRQARSALEASNKEGRE